MVPLLQRITEGRTFKWEAAPNVARPDGVIKPPPVWENLHAEWDDLYALVSAGRTVGYTSRTTAYGTWHFTAEDVTLKDGSGSRIVRRKFAPAKRVKPWFYANFGAYVPDLPVLEANRPLWDKKLTLETFILKDQLVNQTSFHYPGWMCPVCGATGRQTTWAAASYCCAFCRVTSVVPEVPNAS